MEDIDEDIFGFGCKVTTIAEERPIFISKDEAMVMEYEFDQEVYEKVITDFTVYVQQPKPNRSCIETGLAQMSATDHQVVDELRSYLDPNLLKLALDLFIPRKMADFDDVSCQENRMREAFLRCATEPAKPPTYTQYAAKLTYIGGNLFCGDKLVCTAGPFTSMEYAFSTFPRQAWSVYAQIKQDLVRHDAHSHHWNYGGYRNMLEYFRQFRSLSRSMNKITKVGQLEHLDQDSSYFWFDDLIDDETCPVYVGRPPPAMFLRQPGMCIVERSKFLEDPFRYSGQIILSDVVLGSDNGAKTNDKALLKALWSIAGFEDTLVNIHCVLFDVDWSDMCGTFIRKPRPHNLTGVVLLDPDGNDLALEVAALGPKFIQANISRNNAYFDGGGKALKNSFRSWEFVLGRVLDMRPYLKDILDYSNCMTTDRERKKRKQADRPTRLQRRKEDIARYCARKDLQFDGHYYKVKQFTIMDGPLKDLVPDLGPVYVAVNSTVRFVRERGREVCYILGEWYVF